MLVFQEPSPIIFDAVDNTMFFHVRVRSKISLTYSSQALDCNFDYFFPVFLCCNAQEKGVIFSPFSVTMKYRISGASRGFTPPELCLGPDGGGGEGSKNAPDRQLYLMAPLATFHFLQLWKVLKKLKLSWKCPGKILKSVFKIPYKPCQAKFHPNLKLKWFYQCSRRKF